MTGIPHDIHWPKLIVWPVVSSKDLDEDEVRGGANGRAQATDTARPRQAEQ